MPSISPCLLRFFGLVSVASTIVNTQAELLNTDSPGSLLDPAIVRQLGGWSFFVSETGAYGIDNDLPDGCVVDQATLLMRHGFRGPSTGVGANLNALVAKFKNSAFTITPGHSSFNFLSSFASTYEPITPELLLPWGAQEAFDAGVKFGRRYHSLIGGPWWYANFTGVKVPIRTTDQQRVYETSLNFASGFLGRDWSNRVEVLVLPDSTKTFNTSVAVGTCTNSATDNSSSVAFGTWNSVYLPAVVERLNGIIRGINLTTADVQSMQNMCPFHTAASGSLSPFCSLFSHNEWKSFSYGQDLQAHATAGYGGPLGRAWSVGWVNELVARLTDSPVHDATTTNSTLDNATATFPLGRSVYLDFTHDTQLESAMAVMGLLRDVPGLPASGPVEDARLWQVSRIAPMAGRLVAERLKCNSEAVSGTYVRLVLNEGVLPLGALPACAAARQGRKVAAAGLCQLDAFVESQAFAQAGGDWANCVKA